MGSRKLAALGGGVVLALLAGLWATNSLQLKRLPKGPADEAAAGPGMRNAVVLMSPREPYSTYGSAALRGAQSAAKVLRARAAAAGVSAGQPASTVFRVTSYTVKSDSAESIAAELSENLPLKDVDLLLIADDDDHTVAALSAAQKLKVPMFYLLDGPCRTIAAGTEPSPYLWGAGFALETVAEPLLIAVYDRLSKPERELSMLLVGGDTPHDRSVVRYARKVADDLGYKVLDARFTDMRITDYYTFIRDIFAAAPSVLFVSNPSRAGALFLQQAGRLSVAKEMTVIGINSFDAEFLPLIGPAAEGAITVGRYAPSISSKENEEFLASYRNAAGGAASESEPETSPPLPSETALGAYETLLLADAAMQKSGDGDRQRWLTELPRVVLTGPTGRLSADEDNHIFHQTLFILEVQHGTLTVRESLGEESHPRKEGCALNDLPSGGATGPESARPARAAKQTSSD